MHRLKIAWSHKDEQGVNSIYYQSKDTADEISLWLLNTKDVGIRFYDETGTWYILKADYVSECFFSVQDITDDSN